MSTSEIAFVTFSDSSAEDIESAKIFWKSVFLAPHHESNLVSGGMRQRLPTALPLLDKNGKIITQAGYHLPPILQSNDQRRSFGTWIDSLHDQRYISEVNKRREETRLLLKKHREERINLEALAKQKTDKPRVNLSVLGVEQEQEDNELI